MNVLSHDAQSVVTCCVVTIPTAALAIGRVVITAATILIVAIALSTLAISPAVGSCAGVNKTTA